MGKEAVHFEIREQFIAVLKVVAEFLGKYLVYGAYRKQKVPAIGSHKKLHLVIIWDSFHLSIPTQKQLTPVGF